jgi:hypothetical protein
MCGFIKVIKLVLSQIIFVFLQFARDQRLMASLLRLASGCCSFLPDDRFFRAV